MARPRMPFDVVKDLRVEFFVNEADWRSINRLAKIRRQSRGAMSRALWAKELDRQLAMLERELDN